MDGDQAWRRQNMGRLLNRAIARFEGRVFDLLHQQGYTAVRTSHIGLTRNLDLDGTAITELARRAAMTKQAMGELVVQCEAIGLVFRETSAEDARVRIVRFTAEGRQWLEAFRAAIEQAESEARQGIGSAAFTEMIGALRTYLADGCEI
ncbi:MarR family transcriptional regulator [Sphingomonas sp. HH69]|jgi:DNA-binding MarR family transcriptional regulator|nr:MarR family transcriptional regulator [Sphingobium sp. LB126]